MNLVSDCHRKSAETGGRRCAHGHLLLAVLGSIAEFERELIKSRFQDGIKRAKAAGIRFGRKPKLSAFQVQEAKRLREARDLKSAARVLCWMLANGMPISSMTVENENGANGE